MAVRAKLTIKNDTGRPLCIEAVGDTGEHIYQPGAVRTMEVEGVAQIVISEVELASGDTQPHPKRLVTL